MTRTERADTVAFSIASRVYRVPVGMTIIQALDHAGVQSRHGSSCRQGFCGACAMLCRLPGESEVRGVLGCQTLVVDGMDICQVPYFPVHRADFDVRSSEPAVALKARYPELDACIRCGACNRACPVQLDVQGFVQDLAAGELSRISKASHRCVSCALCAVRCPAAISPHVVALQARRADSYRSARSAMLARRVEDIRAGRYDVALEELRNLDRAELEHTCEARRRTELADPATDDR